jgi:hypothetical protein
LLVEVTQEQKSSQVLLKLGRVAVVAVIEKKE